jgi:hypothetical protein
MSKKKITYELVRNSFEKEGYTLLSKEYINYMIKLNYICSKGHEHDSTWNNWQQGKRCPTCAGQTKPTVEQVRKSFEKEEYTLLSKEYKNAYTKLDYVCSKGHKHKIVWGNWQQGQRCPFCYGNIKPTIEQVKMSFEKENYILLSEKYVNSYTKLDYICPKGHQHSIKWNHWQQGQRCTVCVGNAKLTIEQVREELKKENYILVSDKYINGYTKLEYICSEKHKHSIRWDDWKQGIRCPTCADIRHSIKVSGSMHPNWQGGISCEPYCEIWTKEYKEYIKERDGHKCLNPYCSSKKPEALAIHHIDYNKKNCHPSNLITVCRSCNSRANVDRDWHQTWYQAIIKNRYGGIS